MKRGAQILICLLGSFVLTVPTRAVVNDSPSSGSDASNPDSPYSAIWLRNVFDLKPPPPPKTNEPPPAAPPPGVTLNGITTIFGKKRALFTVKEAAQPGKPAGKDETYTLTEGERAGALEVVEIDPKNRNVQIKVDGQTSTITFPTNAAPAAAPAGAPPAMQGGIPRAPGFTPPGFNPGATPFNGASPNLPNRIVRPSADASPYSPQTAGYNPTSYQGGYQGGYQTGGVQGAAGGATTPGLTLPGFGGSAPTSNYRPAPEPAPPEVTAAMMNIQKAAADAANIPYPPLPPPFVVGGPGTGGGSPAQGGTGGSGGNSGGTSTSPPAPPMPTYMQPVFSGSYKPK